LRRGRVLLDAMAEQKTERECAMEAERLGNKLKGAMNSGKSQLVKILKVHSSVEHRTRAPHHVPPPEEISPHND